MNSNMRLDMNSDWFEKAGHLKIQLHLQVNSVKHNMVAYVNCAFNKLNKTIHKIRRPGSTSTAGVVKTYCRPFKTSMTKLFCENSFQPLSIFTKKLHYRRFEKVLITCLQARLLWQLFLSVIGTLSWYLDFEKTYYKLLNSSLLTELIQQN